MGKILARLNEIRNEIKEDAHNLARIGAELEKNPDSYKNLHKPFNSLTERIVRNADRICALRIGDIRKRGVKK